MPGHTRSVGENVHTPFGKGVVREVRSNGRVLVQVRERTLLLDADAVSAAQSDARPARRRASRSGPGNQAGGADASSAATVVLDLHGLTVEEALDRLGRVLNDALLASAPGMRVVHGRSGGKIRAAVHRYLKGMPPVRHFYVDPKNPGVTVVVM